MRTAKREKPFDWEKKILDPGDQWDKPLKYIIKRPTNYAGNKDVLYFMHGDT